MFCPNCGDDQSQNSNSKFCSNCGEPFDGKGPRTNPLASAKAKTKQLSEKLTPFIENRVGGFRRFLNKINLKKVGIFGGGGIALLAMLGVGAYFAIDAYQITLKDKVVLSDLLDSEKVDELVKASCSSAEQLILSSSERATYESQKTKIDLVRAKSDLRSILKYRDANYWTMDSIPDPDTELSSQATKSLDEELSTNPRIMASGYQVILKSLVPEFSKLILTKCGISAKFESNASFISSYNVSQVALNSKADSAPWYPDGYWTRMDGTNEFALKWVERGHDCYSCYQWDLNVISRDGCYGGVYAELNLEQGNSVVGWTNDNLASLDAGQIGKMRFQSYLSGYGTLTASLIELTCHEF